MKESIEPVIGGGAPPGDGPGASSWKDPLFTEAGYRALVQASPLGIFINRANRIVFANPAALRLFGAQTEAELMGKSPFDLFHPDFHEAVRNRISTVLGGTAVASSEEQVVRLDGTVAHVEVTATPLDEPGGRAVLVLLRDISRRKQTEQALRANEERISLVAETSGVGFHDYDVAANRSVWSRQMYAISGVAYGEEITLEKAVAWIHPEDRERVSGMMKESMDPRGTGEFAAEFRVERVDSGKTRWVYNRARTSFAGEGAARKPVRSTGVVIDITEERANREALKESRRRLDWILSATGVGLWFNEMPLGDLTWDERTRGLFFVGPGEKPTIELFWQRLHPDDREPTRQAVEKALRERTLYEIDHRAIDPKTGEIRWIRSAGQAIYGKDGAPVLFDGINYDITDRKRTEDSLVESEARLRQNELRLRLALEAAFLISFEWDIQRDEVRRDLSGTPALQPTTEGRLGTFEEVCQAIYPEDRERFRANIAAAFERADGLYESEHRLANPGGKIAWVYERGRVVRDAAGKPWKLVGLTQDITFRKEAEQVLRDSEERFRTLANSIPNLAWWADADGSITWFNRRWYEYTGTTPEQVEGWGWESVHHPEWLSWVRDQYRTAIQTGQTCEMEFPLKGADGRFRWFLTRVLPLRDQEGKVLRWLGTNTDVTEAREAREVLARSKEELEKLVAERTARLQELVGELEHFSYTITHDMRAPLRAMRGFSEVVNELCAKCPGQEQKIFLRRITTAAERMDALISDALNYSRAVRQELPLAPVDLGALLRGMLDTYPEFQPEKANIRFGNELPLVLGNEAALTQCFSNLLGNAVKFVRPGEVPQVLIRSEPRDEWIRIWVEDQGIGILPNMLTRVFDMFTRGQSTYEGTGIGLALVRKVVTRMGGRVGVESELGKGSRFWVELKPGYSQP